LEVLGKMQQVWINNDNLIDLTKEILAVSGYLRYLKEEYPTKEEFEARVENIGEIYSLMYPFDEDKSISLPERLNNFLAHVMLMSTQDVSDDNTPKVNLMSLHQSKGLEFETVFLVGLEDGILPHQNSLVEPDGLEEEVRLAYVGVTRAKANLFLLSADSRVQFGQIKANPGSRIFRPFLDKFCRRERG
jgi:DNA helicase-2/ATP-dependent DNA helicase PcrA